MKKNLWQGETRAQDPPGSGGHIPNSRKRPSLARPGRLVLGHQAHPKACCGTCLDSEMRLGICEESRSQSLFGPCFPRTSTWTSLQFSQMTLVSQWLSRAALQRSRARVGRKVPVPAALGSKCNTILRSLQLPPCSPKFSLERSIFSFTLINFFDGVAAFLY